jgi:hypothetical protein
MRTEEEIREAMEIFKTVAELDCSTLALITKVNYDLLSWVVGDDDSNFQKRVIEPYKAFVEKEQAISE